MTLTEEESLTRGQLLEMYEELLEYCEKIEFEVSQLRENKQKYDEGYYDGYEDALAT